MKKVGRVPDVLLEVMKGVLSGKQLDVAVNHYVDGRSKKEIAKKLGVCPRRVRFLKEKARKKLKASLPVFHYMLLRENRIKLINQRVEGGLLRRINFIFRRIFSNAFARFRQFVGCFAIARNCVIPAKIGKQNEAE